MLCQWTSQDLHESTSATGITTYCSGRLVLLEHFKTKLLKKLKRESLKIGESVTLSSGLQADRLDERASPFIRLSASDYYIDAKMTTLDSEGAYLTAGVLFEVLKPYDFDAVGGLAIGAGSIVASLAVYSYIKGGCPVPTFIVRQEPKKDGHERLYGMQKMIEGKLGKRVVIVDDIVTTGESIKRVIKAVEDEGCEVVRIVALIDCDPGNKDRFPGYEFESIFTKHDFGILSRKADEWASPFIQPVC